MVGRLEVIQSFFEEADVLIPWPILHNTLGRSGRIHAKVSIHQGIDLVNILVSRLAINVNTPCNAGRVLSNVALCLIT